MIYLIRHTQPAVEKGICYGQTDLNVHDSFNEEVVRIKEKLEYTGDLNIITSPLKRCFKLTCQLFPDHDKKVVADIRELDFGEWEMKPWNALNQDKLKYWGDNFITTPPPGGECFQNLFDRVQNFWQTLDIEKRNFAIVTHDGVIRSILSFLLDIPLKKSFSIEIPYGTVIQLNFFDRENCRIKFL